MMSPSVLESRTRWRLCGLLPIGLALIPLAFSLVGVTHGEASAIDPAFAAALSTSVAIGIAVGVVSLAIGLPAGVLAGLYTFPGRRALLALLGLPILLPPFLWAIGLDMLRASLGMSSDAPLFGPLAAVATFAMLGIPLVTFATRLRVASITGSQADAARLAGGERLLTRMAVQVASPIAVAVASLVVALTMSDAGPGQILGLGTAAGEILTSFSALYDFDLASRQCLVLALVVVVFAVPPMRLLSNSLSFPLLPRDAVSLVATRHPTVNYIGPCGLALLVSALLLPPLTGIMLPLLSNAPFESAAAVLSRTAGNTVLYATGASILATVLGFFMALTVARRRHLIRAALGLSLLLLSLPSALGALGAVRFGATSPVWLDDLFRSRFTVCAVLAARFLPIAFLLALRAVATLPPNWAGAAAVHGVGLGTYLRTVLLPRIAPDALLTTAVIALLATAEVGVVLLLRPPGEDSLPVAIVTVMANAPEALVAALSLAYLGVAVCIGGALLVIARKRWT